jgi:hypothetical protein
MLGEEIPKELADMLYMYCDVNAPEMIHRLRDLIASGDVNGERVEALRSALAKAARGEILTPEQYKKLTGDNEYNDQPELQGYMLELWRILFPNEKSPI